MASSRRRSLAQHLGRCAFFTGLLLAATRPAAQPADASARWDLEIDPLPYALHGHSVHLGLRAGRVRLDLGSYAAQVPGWLQGSSGFRLRTRGVGLKALLFLDETQRGWFAGGGLGRAREHIENRDTGAQASRSLGVAELELGYRFDQGGGFYVSPWLGVILTPGVHDIALGGRVYAEKRAMPFGAVHVGVRF